MAQARIGLDRGSGAAQARPDLPCTVSADADADADADAGSGSGSGSGDLGPCVGREGRGMPTPAIDELAAVGMSPYPSARSPAARPGAPR